MEIKKITHTILEASDGHILTNGIAYGYTIALGANDSADNWHEITIEEYEKLIADEGGDS